MNDVVLPPTCVVCVVYIEVHNAGICWWPLVELPAAGVVEVGLAVVVKVLTGDLAIFSDGMFFTKKKKKKHKKG